MTKSLRCLYLLLMFFHSGVQNMKGGGDDDGNRAKNELSQNVTSCSKFMKGLKIYSPTPETTIGGNVTLECYWETDCLPINYTLFLNKMRALRPATQNRREEKVIFNFTVNSSSELGQYKCKAEGKIEPAYSQGFNFTLRDAVIVIALVMVHVLSPKLQLHIRASELGQYKCKAEGKIEPAYSRGFNFTLRAEERNNLVAFIVPPLVVLLLLIAVVVAIPLLILPWCKTRKLKSANISTAYDDIGGNQLDNESYVAYGVTEENEYCNVKIKTKTEDYRNGNFILCGSKAFCVRVYAHAYIYLRMTKCVHLGW
ncbi:allergin-1 [Python bivittatus]|uniref:Allergin-1 n=1 Tax=Python bivittatus TaxID=176946 RepID=A0A9F5N1D0_PYTBI|nr:allergin-1 [Python bivittatus]